MEAGGEHVAVERQGVARLATLDVGADHGVPQEGGSAGEAAEQQGSVAEVAAGGHGAEGNEFAGCVGVGDGARHEEVGVDLVGSAQGEAGVAEKAECSPVGLKVFAQRRRRRHFSAAVGLLMARYLTTQNTKKNIENLRM